MTREEPEIIDERWVEFYDDTIVAILANIEGRLQVLVPVRPVCEVLGLDWSAQRRRINRDDVLSSVVAEMTTTARDGKRYKMLALPLEYLHGWLFGIGASQVKEEFRDKITLYRRECFQALSTAFQADLALPDKEASPATGMTLAQVRDLGLAIAQMAEQQLALEGRVDETHALATQAHGRLDKAAEVIGALQRRVGTVENRLSPGAAITEDQAAEVSNRVKALALVRDIRRIEAPAELRRLIVAVQQVPDLAAAEAAVFTVLVDGIRTCQKANQLRTGEPRKLAYHVWATIHGVASLLIDGQIRSPIDPDDLIRFSLDALTAGLVPDPADHS